VVCSGLEQPSWHFHLHFLQIARGKATILCFKPWRNARNFQIVKPTNSGELLIALILKHLQSLLRTIRSYHESCLPVVEHELLLDDLYEGIRFVEGCVKQIYLDLSIVPIFVNVI
jgi:hypothetical protein